MQKVDRKKTSLMKNYKDQKLLVYDEADKSELFLSVWEITKDSFAFLKGTDAERRLQRNITTVIRKKS